MKQLLHEIQEFSQSSEKPISDLLRKCIILAHRMGHEDLKKWARKELDGYRRDEELPEYRKFPAEIYGYFRSSAWEMKSAQIPSALLPEDVSYIADGIHIKEPISSVELNSKAKRSSPVVMPLPLEFVIILNNSVKIYHGAECLRAWYQLQPSTMLSIVEAVRTRVLNFSLELEELLPAVLEKTSSLGEDQLKNVDRLFNVNIYGNSGTIALGDHAVTTVVQNDLDSLFAALQDYGVSQAELAGLKQAIEEDSDKNSGEPTLGAKTLGWIQKVGGQLADKATSEGSSQAINYLIKLIQNYCG